jgi:hypothetical protein
MFHILGGGMIATVGKFGLVGGLTALAASLAATSAAQANLNIIAVYDNSITKNANASKIEGAIQSAITVLDNLFSNNLKIDVDFTYNAASANNLLSTSQSEYIASYSTYTTALKAAASAAPANKVLATAVANLKYGNDANGASNIVLTGALVATLGLGPASLSNATININSLQNFSFTSSVSSSQYDLSGGLEHELDEVLGGGGAGSWLNYIQQDCAKGGAYCNLYGALDLYRYSKAHTPSFSTSGAVSSYLSFDGGVTKLVAFNQNSGGDYADFWPPGAGAGQLIQDAFNSKGKDEAFTAKSPEFAMLESLGYDGASAALSGLNGSTGGASAGSAVPEPSTWSMILLGLGGLGFGKYHKSRKNAGSVAAA